MPYSPVASSTGGPCAVSSESGWLESTVSAPKFLGDVSGSTVYDKGECENGVREPNGTLFVSGLG